jgi:FkbM family methyltransferase
MNKILIHLYGNKTGQRFLERMARKAHLYMGIGSGENVYESGEAGVLHKLKTLKPPPYCIFDVGSNKGQYLDLVLSALKGEDFQIHCFEPSSSVFGDLSGRAKNDPRVTLNNIGLGREKGEFDLFFESKESGGSLSHRQLDSFGISFSNSEMVRIDTVDNYCAGHGVDYIHLLKVDIEGHEMGLLLGAQNMFEKRAVGMATFEFGGCNIDTRTYYKDFFYFFRKNGMHVYRITPTGYLHPLPEYREIDEQFRTTNFVAIDNRERPSLRKASPRKPRITGKAFKRRHLPRQTWKRCLWILKGRPMPPPSETKQWAVGQYARKYGLSTLIETGTYEGDMVEAMRGCFRAIHSIEIFEPLYWMAVEKFIESEHIQLYLGDSENLLPTILEKVDEPVLFWLDAHYSGKGTGRGNIDSPIMRELQCVFAHPVKNHVILIDDARLFGEEEGFPTLNEIREFVSRNHSGAEFIVEDDIIRIYRS